MDVESCFKFLLCALLLSASLSVVAQNTSGAIDPAVEATADAEVADLAVGNDENPAEPAESAATVIVPGSELDSMTAPLLRMVLSLAAVLALVGLFAWVAKRFRGAQLKGGLIQIVGGLSLGPKDRVVLLRVGDEEVLVGLSPTGMRPLHVLSKPSAQFSLDMADTDTQG